MKAKTESEDFTQVFLNPQMTEFEYSELIEALNKYKAYYDPIVQLLYTDAPKEFIARLAKKHKCVQSY